MESQRRLKVYIVDDHALISEALAHAIDGPEVHVIGSAETAEDALRDVPGVHPDVMLVDIDLPGMGGILLVRELAPRLPRTAIVMLTVSGSHRDVVDAFRAGAVGYLTKGIRPHALVQAIVGAASGELVISRRLGLALVRELVDAARRPRGGGTGLEALTEREAEVLALLADGLTDGQISTALGISPRTVESHVRHIIRKLGVKRRAEAARQYRAR